MYELIPKRLSGGRCEKCHRRDSVFIFMGRQFRRWQKRCRPCAEKMVC